MKALLILSLRNNNRNNHNGNSNSRLAPSEEQQQPHDHEGDAHRQKFVIIRDERPEKVAYRITQGVVDEQENCLVDRIKKLTHPGFDPLFLL